jgi:hypothetical protein
MDLVETDYMTNLTYNPQCMDCKARINCVIRQFSKRLPCSGGLGSSVSIATDYGLDGPGIESRWGCDFSHTSRLAMGPTRPPVQWVPGLSRG